MTARDEARALLAASGEISPFPWSVGSQDPDDYEYPYVVNGEGSTVAGECSTADADLIAAAPRLLAVLCDELDAVEHGVRWEDVDKATVTAIEGKNGMVWCEAKVSPWPDWYRDALLKAAPVWFRNAEGWHKVAG